MPKLRLFRGSDPLETDAIPFPRVDDSGERFRLRLARSIDPVREVEEQLDRLERELEDARMLFDSSWFDDDGPRAA